VAAIRFKTIPPDPSIAISWLYHIDATSRREISNFSESCSQNRQRRKHSIFPTPITFPYLGSVVSAKPDTDLYGGGSIPVELVLLASAVSSESSTLCDPISALALALRLLSSEPHRVRRWRRKPLPSDGFLLTLARWGRVSSLTLKAYPSPEIPLRRVNGSPRVADFGSQGTAGSPILPPPPN